MSEAAERDEDGVRVLSCQKLCDVIKVARSTKVLRNSETFLLLLSLQEIYASKSKFDKKCIESRLPRETMVRSMSLNHCERI